ncbi:MAG: ATP-binding protein [Candidatus Gastranaerophilaceae bacterium]|jgi:signal transduction histidine kinase|nr:GHKL domain-containing protein [bacterium]MEE0496206.1 ATP-binding protein [Cyanobacteriota bacterium]CDE93440.1 pAS domain S-box/diguanylate cyclase (GGDEF) domain-containing protein [Fusobacterium sp. CAG:815]DAA92610.1 MAG TPA: two-component sensor histidine kinase [Candidatus Gastranaerophilales bacterium HUM_6]DAA92732.1 MAG TPA: two-component sensor histidine kinase [Candidatus Gastranaerophilales bacterium HUM_7]DAB00797.1 MAG TPA: two-component sensor histidine kinase [Candidatus Ga
MKKYRFKRLKIIEQIAIVFFIAVVIPMSISGFIINNINQQSVRHQLRESAILVASMVSDEVDFFLKTNESTLAQIADTLEYLPSKKLKIKFIKDVAKRYPNCDDIIIAKNPQELAKTTTDAHLNEKPILSTQMKDGSFLVIVFNSNNWDNQLFKSLEDDNRQIYIIDKEKHLLASHNFTPDVFKETVDSLPPYFEVEEPIVFGDEKNQPIVYLHRKNPDLTIVVNTTQNIAKKAILDNRVKIILSVLFAILSMMVLIGFYIYYLYINIRQLFKAVIALSKGNYQRQIRLLTTSFTPYEIIFLANEFNNMATEIHKSYLQLKKKNVELKQLNEFRSNLLDTVSHELRTPLTSIQGYTSRLMRQDIVIDEETKQKSLRIIKEQSERLKRLIEDLLTIPDIEGMRLRTVNSNIWINEVFEQSELLLRKRDGHEIIVNLADDFPQIYADKGRLEQVFVNLYENAIKYSYPDTPIIVDTAVNGDKVVIKVKNKCDKISPKKLNSLFEKFVRLDDEMTRTTRGTGLGLFIVKGLVEAMEGTITLTSDDEYGFCATIVLHTAKSETQISEQV